MLSRKLFTCQLQRHYPVIVLLALFWTCSFAGEPATKLLQFDRSMIFSGEAYRLLSAHIVHLSWTHMLMNSMAVVIGWSLFRQSMTNYQWSASMLGCGFVISGLLLLNNDIEWYVGFSGIIHGLMLQGIILDKKIGKITKCLIAAGLLLKVFYELWQGANENIIKLIGGDVVLNAHLFGLIGGTVMLIIFVSIGRHNKERLEEVPA